MQNILNLVFDVWENNKKNPKEFWRIASAPRVEAESHGDREPGRNRFHDLSTNSLA